jgi:hypothetical protein
VTDADALLSSFRALDVDGNGGTPPLLPKTQR